MMSVKADKFCCTFLSVLHAALVPNSFHHVYIHQYIISETVSRSGKTQALADVEWPVTGFPSAGLCKKKTKSVVN